MKYKVGQKVRIKSLDWYNENVNEIDEVHCGNTVFIPDMVQYISDIVTISEAFLGIYRIKEDSGMYNWTDEMIEGLAEEEMMAEDPGEISDGYHTFNELYEYRLLYNACMFNELAKQNLYDVHKSKRHSDGTIPFDNPDYFIVVAELPTGQISNHYQMKDWELFDIPEKDKANKYDGHSPKDVAERLRRFLTPKKEQL